MEVPIPQDPDSQGDRMITLRRLGLEPAKNAICSQAMHHTVSMHTLVDFSLHMQGYKAIYTPLSEVGVCNMHPLIIHDSSSDYDDNKCPTNPDIAGLGVSAVA
jgi:hypothetical protein